MLLIRQSQERSGGTWENIRRRFRSEKRRKHGTSGRGWAAL